MPLPFNITFEVIVNITLQVIVDMTLGAYRRDSNEEVHMAIRLVTLPTVFIAFSILTGVGRPSNMATSEFSRPAFATLHQCRSSLTW